MIVNENDKLVYGSTVEITVSTGNPPAEVKTYTVTINVQCPPDYPTDAFTVKAVYGSQTKTRTELKDIYEFSFEVTATSGSIKVYLNDDEYQTWEFTVKDETVVTNCVSQKSFG